MRYVGARGLYIAEVELIIEVIPQLWRLYSVEELIFVCCDVDYSNQLTKQQ